MHTSMHTMNLGVPWGLTKWGKKNPDTKLSIKEKSQSARMHSLPSTQDLRLHWE